MKPTKFEVTEQHLKLLRNAYVGWENCEFGAPAIDCKRPYGNSSVYHDIGEILGIDPEGGEPDDRTFTDKQQDAMRLLHEETQTVLQIALSTGSFAVGSYEKPDPYGRNWRKTR